MMTIDGRVKLIDFGLAENMSSGPKIGILGSPFWLPPEMVKLEPHHFSADIWSAGISLLELINGEPPNRKNALLAVYVAGTKGIQPPYFVKAKARTRQVPLSSTCEHFISVCLQRDPDKRPSAKELLNHPFMKNSCEIRDMKRVLSNVFLRHALVDSGLFGVSM
jgi:serine/threonine protein kinase